MSEQVPERFASTATGRGRGRVAVRIALAVAIVATAVVMFLHWPLAWLPAVLAAIIYGMDLLLLAIERRARGEPPLARMSDERREQVLRRAEGTIELKTALTIIGALAAIGAVLAAVVVDLRLLGIAALVIFAWLGLLGLPAWLAAVEEEAETEHERLTGEQRSIR